MTKRRVLWFSWGVLFVILGGLFFLFHRRLVVVFCTWGNPLGSYANTKTSSRQGLAKDTKIFFLKNNKWCFQETSVVWDTTNDLDNLTHLIKHWITILVHEGTLLPSIHLQSVAFSSTGGEAYVSFSENPFDPAWSIFRKWQLIESLLKTIVASGLSLSGIRLLVDYRDINDDHLDIGYLIPVQEFLSTK